MQMMDRAHTPSAPAGVACGAGGAPARTAQAYQGVWARTLLETPAGRDTTARVRWVQTGCWQGAVDRQGQVVTDTVDAPGAPHSVFQTSERIVQTGLHDRHLAIWERLPDSRGQRITLARRGDDGLPTAERLLLCGDYLLHMAADPADGCALRLGRLSTEGTRWQVEHASEPAQVGTVWPWHMQRLGMDLAMVRGAPPLAGAWEVLEWTEG